MRDTRGERKNSRRPGGILASAPHPTSNIQRPTSNVQRPTSYIVWARAGTRAPVRGESETRAPAGGAPPAPPTSKEEAASSSQQGGGWWRPRSQQDRRQHGGRWRRWRGAPGGRWAGPRRGAAGGSAAPRARHVDRAPSTVSRRAGTRAPRARGPRLPISSPPPPAPAGAPLTVRRGWGDSLFSETGTVVLASGPRGGGGPGLGSGRSGGGGVEGGMDTGHAILGQVLNFEKRVGQSLRGYL